MGDDDGIDRISQLPEPILHIIISKLPESRDMVRTSVLSKRWTSMWLSFPDLEFQEIWFGRKIFIIDVKSLRDKEEGRQICRKRQEFITCVDGTLSRRHHSNVRTNKFKFESTFPRDLSLVSRMDQWIQYVVDAKVEDFCLRIQSATAYDFMYKLPGTLFDSKTLSILTLQGCIVEPNGAIRLPSLWKLHMNIVYINEQTLQKLLSSCSKLEHLGFVQCRGLANSYIISSPKLKHVRVTMPGRSEVGKVDVKAPNLQCLQVYSNSVPIDINITSCLNLKEVTLAGSEICGLTQSYIQDLISKLSYLENLTLCYCNFIKHVNISSPRLKKFKLSRCANLVEVKIDCPNLVQFKFKGSYKTSILLVSTSSHLEVTLDLTVRELSNHWFVDLVAFFKIFDCCKVLTLEVLSEMAIVIPKELREELLPSLYNVKQLKLIIYGEPTHETVSLVDGLLWICPRVEALSIVSNSDHHKHIEFVYGEQMNSDERPYCCISHPHSCWRHFLREVKIVNFDENEVEKNLREYFIQNVEMVTFWIESCVTRGLPSIFEESLLLF